MCRKKLKTCQLYGRHLTDTVLLWPWCAVSLWLTQGNIVRPEVVEDLDTAYLINSALQELREGRCPQPTATEQLPI